LPEELPTEAILYDTAPMSTVFSHQNNEQSYMSYSQENRVKGRKNKEQMRILISYYHLYEGHWDEENFKDLITQTGFTKK